MIEYIKLRNKYAVIIYYNSKKITLGYFDQETANSINDKLPSELANFDITPNIQAKI